MLGHPPPFSPDTDRVAHDPAPAGEARNALRFLDDIDYLTRLADGWMDRDPTFIEESVLETLLSMLNLDFVGLRVHGTTHMLSRIGAAFGRVHSPESILDAVISSLQDLSEHGVTTVSVGQDKLFLLSTPLGVVSSIGLLIAGARRAGFPERTEVLRLTVAATQASLIFREVSEISDRQLHAEKPIGDALAANERRLDLTINSIPAMAWSAAADGMLEFWNQTLTDFVGLPFDQIVGTGFYRIFHPDDVESMRAAWEYTLATKQPREVDGRIRRSDGEYRWFTFRQNPLLDDQGNVVRWYGIIIDIEDRKRAEDALRGSQAALQSRERELHQIISSIPGLVWSSDENGLTEFWSQQYLDYAGLRLEDVLGLGYLDHIHPDDRQFAIDFSSATVNSRQPGEIEIRLRRADGQFRWFLIRASPFYDAAGNITRWFGVNVDIEERKRAEEELRQSRSDLEHVSRLTTMGELAVSIAHEVNQPLMAIVTNAGTCLRWLDPAQQDLALARKAVERIVRDGHRAGDVVASVRALAQKSALKMRRMDLESVIQEVLELLRAELQHRGVVLVTEFALAPTEVIGDSTQLQQVILNLIMNSVEAMSSIDSSARRLTIRTLTSENFAQFSILDTGDGLSPDSVDRLFEAFFTTKPKGIGMGLSICRSIVDAHCGRIWASNNTPIGCVFSVALPLAGNTNARPN